MLIQTQKLKQTPQTKLSLNLVSSWSYTQSIFLPTKYIKSRVHLYHSMSLIYLFIHPFIPQPTATFHLTPSQLTSQPCFRPYVNSPSLYLSITLTCLFKTLSPTFGPCYFSHIPFLHHQFLLLVHRLFECILKAPSSTEPTPWMRGCSSPLCKSVPPRNSAEDPWHINKSLIDLCTPTEL